MPLQNGFRSQFLGLMGFQVTFFLGDEMLHENVWQMMLRTFYKLFLVLRNEHQPLHNRTYLCFSVLEGSPKTKKHVSLQILGPEVA